MLKGSWKTTTLGVVGIIGAIAAAITALLDGNDTTNVDWVATGLALTTGVGLICARDNSVTSKAAGAE